VKRLYGTGCHVDSLPAAAARSGGSWIEGDALVLHNGDQGGVDDVLAEFVQPRGCSGSAWCWQGEIVHGLRLEPRAPEPGPGTG
jgi:hypothetical protein